MRFPLPCLALLVAGCGVATPAGAAPLRSGLYEGLVLAVAPDGRVTGRYREEQGEGVIKTCAFTLTGRAAANGAAIVARGGGTVLRGRLAVALGGVTLTLPHARDLPGCGLVLMPEIDRGLELDRTGAGGWRELVRVKAARVSLKAQPTGAPSRAYVVRGDVLGVTARRGGQVQVVYPSARANPSKGWVDAATVAPLP